MTDSETRDHELHWDVYVTPGIPVANHDLPPGRQQRVFSPISATLISGQRDAVLVDALLTVEQAQALGEWVVLPLDMVDNSTSPLQTPFRLDFRH
jgi:hypothetical protein